MQTGQIPDKCARRRHNSPAHLESTSRQRSRRERDGKGTRQSRTASWLFMCADALLRVPGPPPLLVKQATSQLVGRLPVAGGSALSIINDQRCMKGPWGLPITPAHPQNTHPHPHSHTQPHMNADTPTQTDCTRVKLVEKSTRPARVLPAARLSIHMPLPKQAETALG